MTIKSKLFLKELEVLYLNFVRHVLHTLFCLPLQHKNYFSKLILYMVL
jgi:hypothetical protein